MMDSLPEKHRQFLLPFIEAIEQDSRIIGIAAIGSLGFGDIDEFSDLDLIVVCEDTHRDELQKNAEAFAKQFGPLLSFYRGHHVGEPRLLVCFFGEPLLHVDFTFMTLDEFAVDRVQVPAILLDREDKLRSAVARVEVDFSKPHRQSIETKFWVWIFNASCKLARGDLFSAISYIGTIRKSALIPLIQDNAGATPRGFRTLQSDAPDLYEQLIHTHPKEFSKQEVARALQAAADIYRAVRSGSDAEGINFNSEAERAACSFLNSIVKKDS